MIAAQNAKEWRKGKKMYETIGHYDPSKTEAYLAAGRKERSRVFFELMHSIKESFRKLTETEAQRPAATSGAC